MDKRRPLTEPEYQPGHCFGVSAEYWMETAHMMAALAIEYRDTLGAGDPGLVDAINVLHANEVKIAEHMARVRPE